MLTSSGSHDIFIAQLHSSQLLPNSATSTAVDSSLNPSVYGQPITFTATITNSSTSATPTGTIEFYDGSTDLGAGTSLSGVSTRITVAALAAETPMRPKPESTLRCTGNFSWRSLASWLKAFAASMLAIVGVR